MFHEFRNHKVPIFFHNFLLLLILILYSYVNMVVQALEEVEKNFATMRVMLSGDGEVEPNPDQVAQLTLEICKENVLALLIHKLPVLKWEVSNDLYFF